MSRPRETDGCTVPTVIPVCVRGTVMNERNRRWIAVDAALTAAVGVVVSSSPVQATPSTAQPFEAAGPRS
jgi:hypothetical protein